MFIDVNIILTFKTYPMNFSKKPQQQQNHSEKFQKSSILFTQLGLVLALLIVYLALEFTTEKKIVMYDNFDIPDDTDVFMPTDIHDIIIEKKVVKKLQPVAKKLPPLVAPTVVPDDDLTVEVLGPPIDDNIPVNVYDGLPSDPEGPEEPTDKIDFRIIEDVPVYPGCEGLNDDEARKCFTKKVAKFVNKKFNTGIAERLNTTGKQRIWVQFTIDKNGSIIDVLANSPFKQLEKEAIRVVQKLPQMTPGMQRKKPVPVKYTLPIIFFIE